MSETTFVNHSSTGSLAHRTDFDTVLDESSHYLAATPRSPLIYVTAVIGFSVNFLRVCKLNMEGRLFTKTIRAALVTDSRGKDMEALFHSYMRTEFTVHYQSGAGQRLMWETIRHIILFQHIDIIYLLGGVCDLSDRQYDSRGCRQFWPPQDIGGRFNNVNSLLTDITNNYLIMYTSTKFFIIPDPGLDLIRYNNIQNPVPKHLFRRVLIVAFISNKN